MQLVALALGAAEKGREQIYKRVFRPAEKRHEPYLERCRGQIRGAPENRALASKPLWIVDSGRATHAGGHHNHLLLDVFGRVGCA